MCLGCCTCPTVRISPAPQGIWGWLVGSQTVEPNRVSLAGPDSTLLRESAQQCAAEADSELAFFGPGIFGWPCSPPGWQPGCGRRHGVSDGHRWPICWFLAANTSPVRFLSQDGHGGAITLLGRGCQLTMSRTEAARLSRSASIRTFNSEVAAAGPCLLRYAVCGVYRIQNKAQARVSRDGTTR